MLPGISGSSAITTAWATPAPLLLCKNWFVYAKPPFAGPEAVLAYLSRYTHRVAISNSRLLALDKAGVTFRYKDYRRNGHERNRTMTLDPGEFIRRFLLHVLPTGFHAFVTMGCSPAPVARPTSRVPADFSRRRSPRPNATEPAPIPPRRRTGGRHVHAAAAG
jgi:hypothetical protein